MTAARAWLLFAWGARPACKPAASWAQAVRACLGFRDEPCTLCVFILFDGSPKNLGTID